MKKDPKIFLIHIVTSVEAIETYINGLTKDQFVDSQQTQDAIIRRVEIIGEAVKNLPNDFRKQHPDVSWKQATGMRDMMIHEYFGVDLNIVWKTINKDLPPFKEQVAKIIKELGGQEAIKFK